MISLTALKTVVVQKLCGLSQAIKNAALSIAQGCNSDAWRASVGVGRLCWVGSIARGMRHGWLGVARHVVHGCGRAVHRSCLLGLKLQLEFH